MVLTLVSQSLENYFALSELDDTLRPQCCYYILQNISFCVKIIDFDALFFRKRFYFRLVIIEKESIGLGKLPQEKNIY